MQRVGVTKLIPIIYDLKNPSLWVSWSTDGAEMREGSRRRERERAGREEERDRAVLECSREV